MLVIRHEQMQAFQAEADRRFVRFMTSQLRFRHPARAADYNDVQLESEAAAGLAAARRYRLDDPNAAGRFIDARFRFGAAFDQVPRVSALLSDPERTAVERVDAAVAAILKVA